MQHREQRVPKECVALPSDGVRGIRDSPGATFCVEFLWEPCVYDTGNLWLLLLAY